MKTVHTEHCCIIHGCKYGDSDCSVALGNMRQTFLCECCDETEGQVLVIKDVFENGFQSITGSKPFHGPIPW